MKTTLPPLRIEIPRGLGMTHSIEVTSMRCMKNGFPDHTWYLEAVFNLHIDFG